MLFSQLKEGEIFAVSMTYGYRYVKIRPFLHSNGVEYNCVSYGGRDINTNFGFCLKDTIVYLK